MRNQFYGWISLPLCLLFSQCNTSSKPVTGLSNYQRYWQERPVVADGLDKEWQKPLMYYDKESRISYSITNDEKHLNLLIKVSDQPTQQKILQAGMQVWIDPSGEQKQQTGILFPLRTEPGAIQELVTEPLRQEMIARLNTYALQGFKTGDGLHAIGQPNEAGIRLSCCFNDKSELVYELSIPLKAFAVNPLFKNDWTDFVSLGIVVNGYREKQAGVRFAGSAEKLDSNGPAKKTSIWTKHPTYN